MNLVLREKLTGVRVIRAFDAAEREEKRFNQANDDLTDTYIKVNRIMAFMVPTIMTIMSLTQLAIIWFGGQRISRGQYGSRIPFVFHAICHADNDVHAYDGLHVYHGAPCAGSGLEDK